ncbi:MAG: AMP-binding protein [Maricaulis sp.]|uniref:AMP-binding protein n=1 Tax=Maricaulis sp. TaxID=1486257 RepID=UPI001AFEF751|nr:AMP-binding protein [Maricaulis sp.]MBO6729001.1 AMP-binding protein [Maricaulis sp.]MBO6846838.1 AMP-binding protein [Maricaulis sp.]MBO6877594.1 AMP-binding protein [Maricaulis sp.]
MAFDAQMRLVADDPERVALIGAQSGERLSQGDLARCIEQFALRLDAGRGIVLIRTDNSINAVIAYLASLHAQCPALLVGAGAEVQKHQLLAQIPVLYVYEPHLDHLDVLPQHRDADLHPDLALLLSTSGSTGEQKLVRLSHSNLLSNAGAICTHLELTRQDRAPTGLPMAYSFGLSIINSNLHAGASLLVTDKSLIDADFWGDVRRHQCTSFSGVPEQFKLLEKTGLFPRELPSLRYVTQAGGRLHADQVEKLARRGQSEGWNFFVMYGQTEAAPRMAYLPPSEAISNPGSIGRAIPGGRLELIDTHGEKVTIAGAQGELVYSGDNVMMGYARNAGDLARGQEVERLFTGDLASRDENGLYTLHGRTARFLKITGKRISLDAVEQRLHALGAEGLAVGQDECLGLVMCSPQDPSAIARQLVEELGIPASRLQTVRIDKLPLKSNGKPDYSAAMALLPPASELPAPNPTAKGSVQDQLLAAFLAQFPGEDIQPETTFESLEASSIEFVDLELRLSAILPALPKDWHRQDIAQLAASTQRQEAPAGQRFYDPVSLRSLGIMLVVLLHVVGDTPDAGLQLSRDTALFGLSAMIRYLTMPLYTLLAGLAFAQLGRGEMAPARFLSHLATTVVLPALIAMVAFAVISTLMGSRFGIYSLDDVVTNLVMPYAHFWYINAFILLSGGAYLLYRGLAEHAIWVATAIGAAVLILPVGLSEDIWAVNRTLGILPFFVLGLMLVRFEAAISQWKWPLLGLALITVVALYPLAYADMLQTGNRADFRTWDGFLLSLAVIVIALHASRLLGPIRPLAASSFTIYLWHVFGTSASRRALEAMEIWHPLPHLLLGTSVGLVAPILLYLILQRLPYGYIVLGQRRRH